MSNIVKILDQSVEKIEYKGTPVVTLRQVDELHRRPSGTARQAFNRHREKMISDEDFFEVPYDELKSFGVYQVDAKRGGSREKLIFLSESGYLMVTKPFTDDLSWKIQRELVRFYFAVKALGEAGIQIVPETVEIAKDRYIELLEDQNKLLKQSRRAPRKASVPFTNADIVRIYDLAARGLSANKIGKEMGRSGCAVSYVIRFRPTIPIPSDAN